MESDSLAPLLQAVHAAYERRDIDEARRLLHSTDTLMDCSRFLHCGDEDYIRWLLSNAILPLDPTDAQTWPSLQERQLQCDALTEMERPRCIIEGEWKSSP